MKTIFVLASVAALLAAALPSRAQLVLYSNNFDQNGNASDIGQNLDTVDFVGNLTSAAARVFTGNDDLTAPSWAVYSYTSSTVTEGFYTAPGTLTPISVTTPGLTFSVDLQSQYNPQNVTAYFAVETSNGQWYASTTAMPEATTTWTTESLDFSASASQWDLLSVGTPSGDSTSSGATIGSAAPSDLTGNIIAAGFIANHTGGAGTDNFDNFAITASAAVPEPSTWALLFLGLGGLFVRLRRRA
jgi:hypothetical protein